MKVITVCGSFKYQKEMKEVAEKLCTEGNCILTPLFPTGDSKCSDAEKIILGKMHLERIRLSDAIIVVDIDNYIGDATKREIDFAQSLGKEIIYYSKMNK